MNARIEALRKQARRRSSERHVAAIATMFIFPAVIGLLGAVTPEFYRAEGIAAVLFTWLIVLIIFGLFFWRWNPTGEDVLSLAVSHNDLEDELLSAERKLEGRSRSIRLLTIQTGYSLSSQNTALTHAHTGIATRSALAKALADLAQPLVDEGERVIFGLGAEERWSFAAYLYSGRSSILMPVWREKSRSHPSTGLGREWAPGEGHVGKSFIDQIPYITGNAASDIARQFSAAPPGKMADYDSKTYVSFAAIPIGPILNQDKRPYGVLVGTSDSVGRFDTENSGILVQIASAMAALLIAGKIDIDALEGSEEVA